MFNYENPIIFDIKTTGLDIETCDIIQIGALAPLSNEEFEIKIQFNEFGAFKTALEVNGYDSDVWDKKAVTPGEAMEKFSDFFSDHASISKTSRHGNPYKIAVGIGFNNIRFDTPIIQRWFKKFDAFLPLEYRTLDVMQLALWNLPGLEHYGLEPVAEHLGISWEGRHDALVNCRITADITAKLLYDEDSNDNLKWVRRRIRRMKRKNVTKHQN